MSVIRTRLSSIRSTRRGYGRVEISMSASGRQRRSDWASIIPVRLAGAAPVGAHGDKGVTVIYRIFLAGASGAIGRRLTPLLHSAGHYVCGSTRSKANADALRSLGADPVVVDVFDASALSRAVASARPDVVIHQLTDLRRISIHLRWEQRSFAPPASAAKERGTSSGPQLQRVRAGWWRKASRGPTRRGRAAR